MREDIIKAISDFIFVEDKIEKADIIFLPGGSYIEPPEYAAKLFLENYAPLILPSGKYPIALGKFSSPKSKKDMYSGDYKTEWEFLKAVLIKNGVNESSILKEDNATYTYQNALFSKKVTDSLNLEIKKAIICAKSYHSRRALMYYGLVYEDTQFLVCPTETLNINKNNWHLSENGINKVLSELQKCGEQFHKIIKNIYLNN